MTISAGFALQQAVFTALKADQALLSLLGDVRIYDAVPPHPVFPYVTVGPHILRDFSTGDSFGREHTLTITAFSRKPGFREVYGLADAVTAALIAAPLSLTGHSLILFRFDNSDVRREANALTSRAAITFRAISEPAN